MVAHPQQIERAKEIERENCLWWELGKIAATVHSERIPRSTWGERQKKAKAAEVMIGFLRRPTDEWCQAKYAAENSA